MPRQKTYWHLLDRQRLPTEYELLSSRLHYYVGKGFEVEVPLQQWYRQYQQGSPLRCSDWERFQDPRQTTYQKYTGLQHAKEVFVDGLLESIEASGYDRGLSEAWLRILARTLAPLRYPCHGFQMIAAYLGSMGPSGKITIAGLFQAADEIRRVQRIAYRVRQLQLGRPGFGADSKDLWQEDPVWQPLREAVERLLVTYDWGEAFTGLNLVLKPMVDGLFLLHFGRLARTAGDFLLEQMFNSLDQDCAWHRQWSAALVRTAIEDRPENRQVLQDWVNRWHPLATQAVFAFAPVFEQMPAPAQAVAFQDVICKVQESLNENLRQAGLEGPPLHDLRPDTTHATD